MNLEIVIHKKFLKELAGIPSKQRTSIETFVFEELEQIENTTQIKGLEKLSGHQKFYKIRFGDYRIGIELTDRQFIIHRVMNRKEIYKFFP